MSGSTQRVYSEELWLGYGHELKIFRVSLRQVCLYFTPLPDRWGVSIIAQLGQRILDTCGRDVSEEREVYIQYPTCSEHLIGSLN